MTYKNCKILIEADRYEYNKMFAMLDLFLLVGRISQEEYIELTGMLAISTAQEPMSEPELDPNKPAE